MEENNMFEIRIDLDSRDIFEMLLRKELPADLMKSWYVDTHCIDAEDFDILCELSENEYVQEIRQALDHGNKKLLDEIRAYAPECELIYRLLTA
jgi:hypothetical protein